jgi:hypothetical protein
MDDILALSSSPERSRSAVQRTWGIDIGEVEAACVQQWCTDRTLTKTAEARIRKKSRSGRLESLEFLLNSQGNAFPN